MTPEYIDTHDSVYNYLVQYFLPELSDPCFHQEAAQEIEQDERMTYCRYMAAWLSHELHYNQIINKLKQLCESDRKAVCLWIIVCKLMLKALIVWLRLHLVMNL